MYPSRKRSSGQRGDDEDESLVVTRIDDRRTEDYPQSRSYSSQNEAHKHSSRSGRAYNDVPSRGRRGDPDWRTEATYSSPPHDRYTSETHTHSWRDDHYERSGHDNGDHWRLRESLYQSSSRDWRHQEHAYSTSHPEDRSLTNPAKHLDNRSDYDQWASSTARIESDRRGYDRDDGYKQADHWSRGDPEHEGLSSRKAHHPDRSQERPSDLKEDRSWEPAASWKSRPRQPNHGQRSDLNSRSNNKRNGKTHHEKKTNRKRDWRKDDGDDMNKSVFWVMVVFSI